MTKIYNQEKFGTRQLYHVLCTKVIFYGKIILNIFLFLYTMKFKL